MRTSVWVGSSAALVPDAAALARLGCALVAGLLPLLKGTRLPGFTPINLEAGHEGVGKQLKRAL